jgi:hypothetical protein
MLLTYVQVVLWISGAVLSVGQALLLALATVEVLIQAVVGQVVRLEQRVPTSLKLLGVNVEILMHSIATFPYSISCSY